MIVSPKLTEQEKYKQKEEAEEPLPFKGQIEFPWRKKQLKRPFQSNRNQVQKGGNENTERIKKGYQ